MHELVIIETGHIDARFKHEGSINFKTKNARQIDCTLQYENKFIANLSDQDF